VFIGTQYWKRAANHRTAGARVIAACTPDAIVLFQGDPIDPSPDPDRGATMLPDDRQDLADAVYNIFQATEIAGFLGPSHHRFLVRALDRLTD